MPMTAQKLFTDTVYNLPPAERFRLACLILDELVRSGGLPAAADSSDIWSERDQEELTDYSLAYAAAVYPEDEDLV